MLTIRADSVPPALRDPDWKKHCTIETCDSYWAYYPSLAANSFFIAIFGLSTVLYLAQGILSKKWLGFTIAMVSGGVLEIIGYAGRIMANSDVYSEVLNTHIATKHSI
jgi:hypothetical protein